MAALFDYRCTCLSTGIAFIPIDGAFFAASYRFLPLCGNSAFGIALRNAGVGNVWLGNGPFGPEGPESVYLAGVGSGGLGGEYVSPVNGIADCIDLQLQFEGIEPGDLPLIEIPCNGETLIVSAAMVIDGTGPGQVTITLTDAEDGTTVIARWVSMPAFQPHCYLQMKLEYWDKRCECGQWEPFPVLQVFVQRNGCLCNGDNWAYRADISIAYEFDPEFLESMVANGYTQDQVDRYVACVQSGAALLSSMPMVMEGGQSTNGCSWSRRIVVPDSPETGCCTIFYSWLRRDPSTQKFYFRGYVRRPCSPDLENPRDRFTCGAYFSAEFDIVEEHPGGMMPQYCLEGPWTVDLTTGQIGGYTTQGEATITPIRLPTIRSGYVSPDCIINTANLCEGAALFAMRAPQVGEDLYQFKWELRASSCENACLTRTCTPQIPSSPTLPTEPISQATAEGLGIWGLIDEEFTSSCGCGIPYVPPGASSCYGTPMFEIVRFICEWTGAGYHLYDWSNLTNPCSDGECESGDCTPQPPYALPPYPVHESAAGELIAKLGVPQAGICGCVPPYEPATCPPCEGNCQYLVAGYTSANGTFGTQTGALEVIVTSDGTSGGTYVGSVFLNVSVAGCTGCGCPTGVLHRTNLATWGVGGFPSSSANVGQTFTYACDSE